MPFGIIADLKRGAADLKNEIAKLHPEHAEHAKANHTQTAALVNQQADLLDKLSDKVGTAPAVEAPEKE